jgi:hypothetical protein
MAGGFCLFILVLICTISSLSAVATRTLCYTGSDLYQKLTVDCNAQEPDYKGEWYCASISVCEQYISTKRNCITTRGCAKAAQCVNGATKYNGDTLQVNGQNPGGMTIQPKCCQNSELFNNDDGALNYNLICNASARGLQSLGTLAIAVIIAVGVAATQVLV